MTDESPKLALSVSGLATGYGDLRVVWDASLGVHPGELTAVLGRNGAGKTTVLRAIAGLNRCSAGTVTLHGTDIANLAPHQRAKLGLALVQENKRIFRRRTVHENILLGGYALGLRRRALGSAADDVYSIFPALRSRGRTIAGQLSGGQQQMVAIGQALMGRPTVLMLDEPSSGLAPGIVADLMATVAALKSTGLAVLLIEQAIEAALHVADRVVVLEGGRTVLSGPARDFDDVQLLKNAYFNTGSTPAK